jgi:histone H3/H4
MAGKKNSTAAAATTAAAGVATPQAVAKKVLVTAGTAVTKSGGGVGGKTPRLLLSQSRAAEARRNERPGRIARPTIRRMIRRAGIYRVSTTKMHPRLAAEFEKHRDLLIEKAVLYTKSGDRKLVTVDDVVRAYLLVDGRRMAGVEDPSARSNRGKQHHPRKGGVTKKKASVAPAPVAAPAPAPAPAQETPARKKRGPNKKKAAAAAAAAAVTEAE